MHECTNIAVVVKPQWQAAKPAGLCSPLQGVHIADILMYNVHCTDVKHTLCLAIPPELKILTCCC